MNTRAFTLSLVMALIAVYMAYTYVEGQQAKYVENFGKQTTVVVAKKDIEELELIDDSKVTTISIPQNFVAPGAVTTVEEIYNTIATVPILKNEQITKPRITYPGQQTGLARQVSPGKRAIAVQVSPDQAVSKLIKPGDRVDVIKLLDYAGGKKDKFKVKTILQDVLVLSTGLSISNSIPIIGRNIQSEVKQLKLNTYTNYDTITLEVDPFQVQQLIFLMGGMGGSKLFFSLRNNDDKNIVRINSTRLFDLMGDDAPEVRQYFDEENQGRRRGGK
jgi:pilus assembly protein CpaB